MTKQQFEEKMQQIDADFSKREISILARPLHAMAAFNYDPNSTQQKSFRFPRERDQKCSQYEWPNACFEISDWYETMYGSKPIWEVTC